MLQRQQSLITICIPHWQAKSLITVCLRSIRKHSKKYDLEVIVVDNGSKDESLDYLRSLKWLRLIERPEETHTNWPMNAITAWDRGIQEANGDYFITMHSDVFVKRDDWLDPFLERMDQTINVAGVGAWKLRLENPVYTYQKLIVGNTIAFIKNLFGKKKRITWRRGHYPRDYCAMYRRDVILKHKLTFCPPVNRGGGGGEFIATQLWNAGYKTRMIPVREIYSKIVHIAHGTAAVASEKRLHRKHDQTKVERTTERLFSENWVRTLQNDSSLDH